MGDLLWQILVPFLSLTPLPVEPMLQALVAALGLSHCAHKLMRSVEKMAAQCEWTRGLHLQRPQSPRSSASAPLYPPFYIPSPGIRLARHPCCAQLAHVDVAQVGCISLQ